MEPTSKDLEALETPSYSSADIGALAHLYRGELYRSKIWRMRLDTTTNWAVVTTGIVFSVVYAQPEASAAPLAIVGLVLLVFLLFEARRYRFFDVWRVRVRVMETQFMTPLLLGRGMRVDNGWHEALADDYTGIYFHLSFWEAFGRRLRRNYGYIFAIQGASYYGKILVHPTPFGRCRDGDRARGPRAYPRRSGNPDRCRLLPRPLGDRPPDQTAPKGSRARSPATRRGSHRPLRRDGALLSSGPDRASRLAGVARVSDPA